MQMNTRTLEISSILGMLLTLSSRFRVKETKNRLLSKIDELNEQIEQQNPMAFMKGIIVV